MTIIYNSVSEDLSSEASGESALPVIREPIVIGGVIRLLETKGLDQTIRAAALLRQRGLDIGVLFVGEGPMRRHLQSLADELSVPLYLPGARYGKVVLDKTYERLTVTVIPENLGLTGIQSLQAGTPAITQGDLNAQMPEAEAIIEGVTGSFFKRGDIADLARCVEEWVDRIGARPSDVAANCKTEVRTRWNAGVSASIIAETVSRL